MPIIHVALLVQVVAIVVSPCGLFTFWDGLGVAILFEQLIKINLVLGGGADSDLLVLAAAAGSADGNVQVISSQPHYDLHHGMCAAAQAGRNIGADVVRPNPPLPRRQLVHLEYQCLDGDAHLGRADALDQIFHGLVVPIHESGWCCHALPRSHSRDGSEAGARPLTGLSVPLLAGVEGASVDSVHTTLAKGHQ